MNSEDSKKVIEERLAVLDKRLKNFQDYRASLGAVNISTELDPPQMQEAALLVAALHLGNCLSEQTEALQEQTEVLRLIHLNTEHLPR